MDNEPAKREQRYEGKAKKVFATSDPGLYRIEYKDEATAFNAKKRGMIAGKGALNNAVSARLFEVLAASGVATHFVRTLGERAQLVRALAIIPIEVVVRNLAAGSFAARYGVDEGRPLSPTVVEWCLKSDALGDPPMNSEAAVALDFASDAELATMREAAARVNEVLRAFFAARGLVLVDFKLEFGRDRAGEILLADEISPDTCRLWDIKSGEKLDKDRFRRDLGGVEDAYREVARRVLGDTHA